jgi:5-methylcytosine-specific restriction endonuclease McrA
MPDNEHSSASHRRRQIVDAARRMREQREKTYREQALRLFPWICARCGREFSGKKLRELTVHHKDHDHDNNPPDGSNWELLCIYCHENEHSRQATAAAYGEARPEEPERASIGNHPFADLAALLKDRQK